MTPPDWPAVEPVPRAGRWLFVAALAISTFLLATTPFVGLPEPSPWWRPVVAAVGLVVAVAGLVVGWTMLLRGTLRRPVPGRAPVAAASRAERRRLYRALRNGDELDEDGRRRIAAGIAADTSLRWVTAMFAAIFGTNVATSTRSWGGSTLDMAQLVLAAVPLLAMLAMLGTAVWRRRVQRAAAAAGALPVVHDRPVGKRRTTAG